MGSVPRARASDALHDANARVGPPRSDVVVVNQSHTQRDAIFTGLTVLVALGLFNNFRGPGTTGDRVSGAVFFGVLIVVVVIGWWRTARRASRIEVSAERLRFLGKSSRPHPDLIRDQGADLVMYPSRAYLLMVEQPATSVTWPLPFYTGPEVAAACTSCGWHVENRRRRDRRAFERRVTGTAIDVGTVPGAAVTEAVGDANVRVAAPPSDVVMVKQGHAQRDAVYGVLTALFGFALIDDGLLEPLTTSDRVTGVIVFGALLVVVVIGWWWAVRRHSRIEVSAERLRFVARSSRPRPDLIRDQGADLVMYTRRVHTLTLEQVATSLTWRLPHYTRSDVVSACASRGWNVANRRRRRR